MRHLCGFVAILVFVALAWSAQPANPARKAPATKTTSTHKTTTARKAPAKRSTTASRSGATRTAASKSGKKGAPARRTATTWRNRQLQPTPERYRQIQEALVAKGYLKSEDATGSWNQNSIDAMKRFQQEQNIESSGKINSLSLIALGLGPKHENVAKPSLPAQAPAQEPGR